MIFLEVVLFFPEKESAMCRNDFSFHPKMNYSCNENMKLMKEKFFWINCNRLNKQSFVTTSSQIKFYEEVKRNERKRQSEFKTTAGIQQGAE